MNGSKPLRTLVTLVILSFILSIWFFQVQPFNLIALKLNDLNFKFNNTMPNSEVLFVEIGEQSINHYGRWPWDREVLAESLSVLSPAKVVLLDIVFSEKTTTQADAALADKIYQLNNTVCSLFLRNHSTQAVDPEVDWLIADSALERFNNSESSLLTSKYRESNILSIQESCLTTAAISTPLDADTLARRYPVAFWYDNLIIPSLGIQGLRQYLNSDITLNSESLNHFAQIADYTLPVEKNSVSRLNYYDYTSYQRIPFIKLVSGEIDNSLLNNKIIILGISEAGVTDMRSTPIGTIPGPLIHYTFIANTLDQNLLTHSLYFDAIVIILLTLLPLLILNFFPNLLTRVGLYAVSILLFIILGKILYIYQSVMLDSFYSVIGLLAMSLYYEICLYRDNESENRFLTDAFKSYVSPDLLKEITKDRSGLALGGEERYVTLLFSDIRGFSTISENHTSHELVQMLNEHFEPITKSIIDHGGMLDKYIGDAVMAIFNAPLRIDNHPQAACRSAIEMIQSLQLDSDHPSPFRIGVGINSGDAIVGNMGSSLRFSYTAIGDMVNTASRLEGLCKEYKTTIIISEETASHLDESFTCRCLGPVYVKGKQNPIIIYELMLPLPHTLDLKRDFDAAFAAYAIDETEEAMIGFKNCIEKYSDATSEVFLQRCLIKLQNISEEQT